MEESNLIFMTNLELILIVIFAIIVGFCFGLYTGLKASDYYDENENDNLNINEDLYCFQCEIEMPVLIKNNNAYCKNCGLHHGERL